jgi:hypothetical protein
MSRLGTAIGLGYGGNPQRSDGTDEFRQEFARGQARNDAKAAAQARALDENRKAILGVMKDMVVTAPMQPYLAHDLKERISPYIAALAKDLQNPGSNSAVHAYEVSKKVHGIVDHYKKQNANWEAAEKAASDAYKSGEKFAFMDSNPIKVGGVEYKNVLEALDLAPESRTSAGFEEIKRQAYIPGQFDMTRDRDGNVIISPSLSIPVYDVNRRIDESISKVKEPFTVVDEKSGVDIKGPYGHVSREFKTRMTPELIDDLSLGISSDLRTVNTYINEAWKIHKRQNPDAVYSQFIASDEAKKAVESIPSSVKELVALRTGKKSISGAPRSDSGGYDPTKKMSVSLSTELGGTLHRAQIVSNAAPRLSTVVISGTGIPANDQTLVLNSSSGQWEPATQFLMNKMNYAGDDSNGVKPGEGSVSVEGKPEAIVYDSGKNRYYAEYLVANGQFGSDTGVKGAVPVRQPISSGGKAFSEFASAYGLSNEQLVSLLNKEGGRVKVKGGKEEVDFGHNLISSGVPYSTTPEGVNEAAKHKASGGGAQEPAEPKRKKFNPQTGRIE